MAFSKKTIEAIAAALKIKKEDLDTAIAAKDEVDVVIPDGLMTFTTEELATRDTNKKTEHEKVGKELAIKDLKKAANLTYDGQGSLDPDRFVREFKTATETELKLPADQKLQAATATIADLQKKVTESEQTIAARTKEAADAKFDASLLASLPANRNPIIQDSEYISLVKSSLQFDTDGVKKGGQILRDKLSNPIPVPDAIKGLFEERKWIQEGKPGPDGRGGKNTDTGGDVKPSKMSEATAQWEKDNPGKGVGPEFHAYVGGLVKENKDFNHYE